MGYNVDIVDLLQVLFIGLKLGGVINWSWWWVFSPILITGVGTLIAIIGMIIYYSITL